MNSIAGWFGTMGLVGMGAICPQVSVAEEFTGKQFLAWEEKSQEIYIADSIVMMVILSNDTDGGKDWSDCLDDWYFGDQPTRLGLIKRNIARFENFHPQLTIYASARKACGRF